ncbi:MAG: lysylphosphatidylglycerol synthase transmembrane domain-containing protein [Verrucomicrobiota bacterium]
MPCARTPGVPTRLLRYVFSYGLTGACLYWVFHDLKLPELFQSFTDVKWWLIAPAIIFDLLVYVIAGWEWQILLRPVARLFVRQTTQAVFAGRFANDVLPVHVGYVVRLYLASRWARKPVACIVPSLLVERLFDGLWLALGIGLTAIFFPLPGRIAGVAKVWAAIIGIGVVIGAVIVLRKGRGGSNQEFFRRKWLQKLFAFGGLVAEEIRAIGRSHLVVAALALSLLKFVVQGMAFLFVLWAYGFQLPIEIQIVVFLIAYVGISMPSTPASVGVFQLFCVAALQLFQVPKPAATGFALLAFVVLTLPLSIAGCMALAQSGLTLHQVRSEAKQWRLDDQQQPD